VSLGKRVLMDLSAITFAMRELLGDASLVAILRAEKLDDIPAELVSRVGLVK